MAIRNIVLEGDPILTKKCREVTKFDERLHQLLDDMAETMYNSKGVGLAASHIGVLKRVVVVDIGDGVVELVNPIIMESKGEQRGLEGSVSFPGKSTVVIRPNMVKISAQDRNGDKIEIFGRGLKARVFCHEIDQLNGILFLGRAESISGNSIKYGKEIIR